MVRLVGLGWVRSGLTIGIGIIELKLDMGLSLAIEQRGDELILSRADVHTYQHVYGLLELTDLTDGQGLLDGPTENRTYDK